MPGAVFGDDRLVAFRVKCDALNVAVTVGKDARVETLRCGIGIAGSSIAITVNAQDLGTQVVPKLRQAAVVVVAGGYIQETILRAEANAPPVVGTGVTERMIRGCLFVRNVCHDVGAIRHRGQVTAHIQSQHPIGSGVVAYAMGGIDVDGTVVREIRVQRDAVHAGLTGAEQIVSGHGIAFGAAHTQQVIHRAIGQLNREALALFSEEHGAVGQEGQIPGTFQPV